MPIQPVRFSTPDDVYKFLTKLRARKLINYEEGSDKITPNPSVKLSDLFLVATDHETYFLPDLLDLSNEDKLLSDLQFAKKSEPSVTLSLFTDRNRLESENSQLIHNNALAEAI